MKVLSIGSDVDLFAKNSGVRQRIVEYGSLMEELHIVVFTKKGYKKQNFGNVFLYPTNSKNRWFYVFDAIRIGGQIEKPDLITTQDPFESGLVGWRLMKYFSAKLQLQIHTDFMSSYFAKESWLNRLRVLIAKFLIPKADCIRVVSKRIKNSILGRLNLQSEVQPPSIKVLPIWIDVEQIRSAQIKTDLREKYPQFDFIILMASRLTKEKNIGLAIKAMSGVVQKCPKTGLVIVGEGPEKENLKFKIKNLKLRDNVVIEKWSEDLISYYKTTDLFLLTSRYEGYGRTLMEASVAGCKIVSSDVGIAPEILEEENIFKVGDKDDLEKKLINAILGEIESPKLLASQTKEQYLEEYKKSWEQCGC
ncbi:MAG: glycosyltransferase [Patescibacteria group bacterium]